MIYHVIGNRKGIGKTIDEELGLLYNKADIAKYDIEDCSERILLVEDCNQCDIIVNNAFGFGYGQIETLIGLLELYKDEPKYIIDIASINAVNRHQYQRMDQIEYDMLKNAQVKLVDSFHNISRKLQVTSLQFGTVDTGYNKNKDIPKMTTLEIAGIVNFCVSKFIQGIEIKSIKFSREF